MMSMDDSRVHYLVHQKEQIDNGTVKHNEINGIQSSPMALCEAESLLVSTVLGMQTSFDCMA